MNFAELYKSNKESVVKSLTSMWCGEANNPSQEAYVEQMKALLDELIASKDAIPVVQCMNSYESVNSVPASDAESVVGNLWQKTLPKGVYYSPYEHQYRSWKTLLTEKTADERPKSIVVTTGTGSGKTECFMLPLVYDLEEYRLPDGDVRKNLFSEDPLFNPNQIQAIFLYPLNALMEDQKERLEQLLDGTHLRYAVYNGDLPENEPKPTDKSDDAEKIRHRIELITGGKYELKEFEDKGVKKKGYFLQNPKFKHMLYTRKQVRKNPPNILLTNPTMLEYILLRGADATLIDPQAKSLRWVTIDETHTYTGAGAAELAMLLRRVLLAFNVDARDIRFATSSATFGNAKTPEELKIEQEKLKGFIAGITGLETNQVEVIDGKRVGEDKIPDNDDKARWEKIFKEEYVRLSDLFPGEGTIEEKLRQLDAMCAREEERYKAAGQPVPDMKLKVHYFYRVPNNGLYVRLDEHRDDAFRIYTENTVREGDKEKSPLLELSRCKHCGEYVAVGMVDTEDGTYEPMSTDDSDMFDFPESEDDESKNKYYIFGLSNEGNQRGDNNVKLRLNQGHLESIKPGELRPGEWHIVANVQCSCPYCNTKQTPRSETDKDREKASLGDLENNRLQKFRLSSEFISRRMAPSILDQLDKHYPEPGEDKIVLHDGQQYISFVDSRQGAAQATLKQNLEQERLWFYTTIYHELCRRRAEATKYKAEVARLKKLRDSFDEDEQPDEWDDANNKLRRARAKLNGHITWKEIAELITSSEYCPVFCSLFVKRSADSDELEKGEISKEILERYVYSIMVMYLANRLTSAASPETLGLFHTCYPQLKNIKELPRAVEEFNRTMDNPANEISLQDWKDLIQVYMDFTVRSNQSVFLRLPDNDRIDIFRCVRFATEKPRRRPVMKPKLEPDKISQARVVKYLCGLIHRDDPTMTDKDAYRSFFPEIEGVVNALWDTVNNTDNKLLEQSFFLSETGAWTEDKDDATRFNLANLSFKLYDEAYLCDSTTDGEERHTERLRPIETNFKHFAPYLAAGNPVELRESLHEVWEPYPYFVGNPDGETTKEKLNQWAKEKRSLLWNNRIWGEDGVFSAYLEGIHLTPNLFIQAEHTAQVDKDVARTRQSDFKEHSINILACSTTMEMGVDLGNLEVVVLSSVPPMPANYKQRAGRSGRNNKVRSACITLCGSDAIGLRTLYSPIEKIISRPVHVPSVDLMSPQVVQRHVNSYLVRSFGVFSQGANGGSLKQKVVDYFTTFHIGMEGDRQRIFDSNNDLVSPSQKFGDEAGTMYQLFNEKCTDPLDDEIRKGLRQLLRDTVFEGKENEVVGNAYEANCRCYKELSMKIEDYAEALANTTNENFRNKLYWLYMEILNTRLLNYWATSRFTPNANMPVNVLSLDLSTAGKKSYFSNTTSSNPSYSLREAIAQYAPGNSMVVDGVVYIVRGVETSSIYQDSKPFKKIYHDRNKTVINDETAVSDKLTWPVNNRYDLDLVQPARFLPDMNEDRTRILDSNVFTHVSAQLIDADEWTSGPTDPHLISIRSNKESGDAQILYYNEGKGYGYCFCTRCGRTVLEEDVADKDNPWKLPYEMNPQEPKTEGKRKFHFAITGKEMRKPCHGSYHPEVLRRNVIIGDTILTDFSEIRIRHKNMPNRWISNRDEEYNLLYTLGIVFTQALVDILGKERGAVDFAIMPNGHIAIFDTNPGGAGYSNQLSNILVMKDVITASEEMLRQAKARKSKDMLLDKFTLRYMKYIDIDAAMAWIAEENEAWHTIPEAVQAAFPDGAVQHTLLDLRKAMERSVQTPVLFVDDEVNLWDYNDSDNSWQNNFLNMFLKPKGAGAIRFCVARSTEYPFEEPVKDMLRSVNGWAKDVISWRNKYAQHGLYPLAWIDGELYFTNNKENATLNGIWGGGALFSARTNIPDAEMMLIELRFSETAKDIILTPKLGTITSGQLGSVLFDKAHSIINTFGAHCKASDDPTVKVTYQDEHLKSVFGMVLTLQTIGYFAQMLEKNPLVDFKVWKYDDYHAKMGVQANMYDSTVRNRKLMELAESWAYALSSTTGLDADIVPVICADRGDKKHWRELSFICGGKKLSIYPDGGFANGWTLNVPECRKHYTQDNTTTADNMPMRLRQDIRFVIALSDV